MYQCGCIVFMCIIYSTKANTKKPTLIHPLSPKSKHKVQLLVCKADSGTFTLTFREHTTTALPFDAGPSVVAAALEGLGSIVGRVDVWYSSDIRCVFGRRVGALVSCF